MINCISVPLNVLTIMVQGSSDNRLDSFLVGAVARNKLVLELIWILVLTAAAVWQWNSGLKRLRTNIS